MNIITKATSRHYFLAQGGVNVREIGDNLKKIESTVVFQPSDMVKNTDIEVFLLFSREKKIQLNNNTFLKSYLRQKHKNIAAEAVKEFKTSTVIKDDTLYVYTNSSYRVHRSKKSLRII